MNTRFAWLRFFGRELLGVIFLLSALSKLANWESTVVFVRGVGISSVILAVATALELLGSLSLMSGFKTRWGAIALLLFIIPVTFVMHAFWREAAPPARQAQMVEFMKNLAIMGGLLTVLGTAPDPLSVDAWRAQKRGQALPGPELGRRPRHV